MIMVSSATCVHTFDTGLVFSNGSFELKMTKNENIVWLPMRLESIEWLESLQGQKSLVILSPLNLGE